MRIKESLFAGLGTTLAIGVLALLDKGYPGAIWLMAPFGATAVLLFGVPDSPLAQPKNVVLGHVITAVIGIGFAQYVPVSPLTLALATGVAVTAMLISRTTHPPAGANPIVIMVSGQSWGFLITPVLLGAILMVAIAQGCRWCLRRRVPDDTPSSHSF
ncbi:HPP family protein [Vibrio coralliilyticus]|uniref:HPP family protein n=1 Tax=Vibrio coralliilyticus TaxID=190893 RepID=A0A837GB03_9VIBR|nr:HPP family protein [Vibrio coralliilyticus]KJY73385.1 HPP family protein [Vibrio coralliilyticus]